MFEAPLNQNDILDITKCFTAYSSPNNGMAKTSISKLKVVQQNESRSRPGSVLHEISEMKGQSTRQKKVKQKKDCPFEDKCKLDLLDPAC